MKKLVQNPICFLLLTAFISLNVTAFAQGNAFYLKVKGAKQGDIKGDVTEKGKEGLIKAISYQHEVSSPSDAATARTTGKRQHKPMIISKEVDKSTPLLYAALTTNETLPETTLNFYRTGKTGASEMWYSIKLKDASISGIKSSVNDKGVPMEEISLSYQKIEWKYTDGGITHEDSWSGTKN